MEEIKKRGNAAAIFISKDNLIEPPDFYYGRVLAIDADTVSLYDAHNKKMKVLCQLNDLKTSDDIKHLRDCLGEKFNRAISAGDQSPLSL